MKPIEIRLTKVQHEHISLATYYLGYLRAMLDLTSPEEFSTPEKQRIYRAMNNRLTFHIGRINA